MMTDDEDEEMTSGNDVNTVNQDLNTNKESSDGSDEKQQPIKWNNFSSDGEQ